MPEGAQFKIQLSPREIDAVKATFESLNYADIQHWLLDMLKLTLADEIDFYDWQPRKNLQTDLVWISVRLPAEYKARAERAIKNAGFTTIVQWCLACIDWTLSKVK